MAKMAKKRNKMAKMAKKRNKMANLAKKRNKMAILIKESYRIPCVFKWKKPYQVKPIKMLFLSEVFYLFMLFN